MSKWFERNPELLERESRQLQSSSVYNEEYQKRKEHFISAGFFQVRYNGDVIKYPAVIVYPEATPYALPQVYLLQEHLTEDEARNLAALKADNVSDFLKPRAKLYYHRHQAGNGSLCLLEQDNVDRGGLEAFEAKEVLRRVHKWLTGLSTDYFPPDSNEVELFAHYPERMPFNILVTEDFYKPALVRGEFFLNAITAYSAKQPLYAISACLIGEDTVGLYLDNPSETLPFMPEGLNSREKLARNIDLLQQKINEREIIKGYWWQIDSEPCIYSNTTELAKAVGNSDNEAETNIFLQMIWSGLKRREDIIFVGLRFLNRRNEQEWLFLLLYKERNDNQPILMGAINPWEVLRDYDLYSVYSEPFTEDAFFLRNSGRVDHNTLKGHTLSLLGCGALGSELADCLGKAGVGSLCLNDYQFLHAHNAVRHLAGISHTARLKVDAVGGVLKDHNPFLNLELKHQNVLTSSLSEYTASTGIVVSTMADDNIESYVNEQAIEQKRTVFYARALRGGKAARIFKVKPGDDACFNCLSLHREDKNPSFVNIPEDLELPTIRNECNNPIRPASAADLKLIASITSRIVLDYLQDRTGSEINHWVWISERELGLGATSNMPQALLAKFLPPHPKCPLCRTSPKEISVRLDAISYMRELTLRTPGVETGGILVGRTEEDGKVIIEAASGPGPKAIQSATGFNRDVAFCQKFMNEHATKGLKYIGEWHSHPNNNNQPSGTDLRSLTEVANQCDYLTTWPVMIIFTRSGDPSCTVHSPDGSFQAVKLIEEA